MAQEEIEAEELYGTWKLVETRATNPDGRPLPPPWGPEPMGRLVLARNGRMMAVLCDGRVSVPDGETRAYSSYCGNFRIEGGRLVTLVDAAAVPARIGSEQVRGLAREGERLVLFPPRAADGVQRELVWECECRG